MIREFISELVAQSPTGGGVIFHKCRLEKKYSPEFLVAIIEKGLVQVPLVGNVHGREVDFFDRNYERSLNLLFEEESDHFVGLDASLAYGPFEISRDSEPFVETSLVRICEIIARRSGFSVIHNSSVQDRNFNLIGERLIGDRRVALVNALRTKAGDRYFFIPFIERLKGLGYSNFVFLTIDSLPEEWCVFLSNEQCSTFVPIIELEKELRIYEEFYIRTEQGFSISAVVNSLTEKKVVIDKEENSIYFFGKKLEVRPGVEAYQFILAALVEGVPSEVHVDRIAKDYLEKNISLVDGGISVSNAKKKAKKVFQKAFKEEPEIFTEIVKKIFEWPCRQSYIKCGFSREEVFNWRQKEMTALRTAIWNY